MALSAEVAAILATAAVVVALAAGAVTVAYLLARQLGWFGFDGRPRRDDE